MYLLDPSGLTGLEPAASALTGRCSDQLNYNPREIRYTTPLFLGFNSNPKFMIFVLYERHEWYSDIYIAMHFLFSEIDMNYIISNPFLISKLIAHHHYQSFNKKYLFSRFLRLALYLGILLWLEIIILSRS